MEYCCHDWAGAPSCYLDLIDKLQKQICRIVGPSLAASLEPLAHCQNVATFSLFSNVVFLTFLNFGITSTSNGTTIQAGINVRISFYIILLNSKYLSSKA